MHQIGIVLDEICQEINYFFVFTTKWYFCEAVLYLFLCESFGLVLYHFIPADVETDKSSILSDYFQKLNEFAWALTLPTHV